MVSSAELELETFQVQCNFNNLFWIDLHENKRQRGTFKI